MAVTIHKTKEISLAELAAGTNESTDLLLFVQDQYKTYGASVVENRSLGDYRDGLKPVMRRIMWGMSAGNGNLGLKHDTPYRKSATVVGHVMGKYHPHGDQALYGALVASAHLAIPLIDAMGNFGSLTDNAAAMRYTECRLSAYAEKVLLDPRYLAITKLIDNYDGKEKEPFVLPSLLPNLMINGTYGIAFGVNGIMPPFHIDCLMPMIEDLINGKTIGPKGFKKRMKFNWPHGGVLAAEEDRINTWLKYGGGGIAFAPVVELDYDKRLMVFTQVPPYFNWETVVGRMARNPNVADCQDMVSKVERKLRGVRAVQFTVRIKTSVPRDDLKEVFTKVTDDFYTTVSMATNCTIRKGADKVEFRPTNLPNLLSMWVEYRTKLEQRMQEYLLSQIELETKKENLLRFAIDNRKILIASLESQDPKKYVVQNCKVSEEDANFLIHLALIRLAKITGAEVDANLAKLAVRKKTAIKHRDYPGPKALSDMSDLSKLCVAPKR